MIVGLTGDSKLMSVLTVRLLSFPLKLKSSKYVLSSVYKKISNRVLIRNSVLLELWSLQTTQGRSTVITGTFTKITE